MILVIDNYDSFTYNLVQYLGELNADPAVYRNDAITITEIEKMNPDGIILSSGPGTYKNAGICNDVIKQLGPKYKILGISLGLQCIGHVYGGKIIEAHQLMYGKTSFIHHDGKNLFQGLPNPFEAIRYHSLVVQQDSLPDELEVSAETKEGEIMGLKHREYPIYGLQFHPESILTTEGKLLLQNFLNLKIK